MILPSRILASINRGIIKEAVACGISSETIISFLTSHCSSMCAVPKNVMDQIVIWEQEESRLDLQRVLFVRSNDIKASLNDALNDDIVWRGIVDGEEYLCVKDESDDVN